MKHSIFLSIILLATPLFLYSQDETAEELFEDGDYFFARGDYSEAAYLYRKVLALEPQNYNINFKLGMAYLNIEDEEYKAIPYFLKATEFTTMKYRKNYYPLKVAPYHAWYYLGDAYRINNELDKALDAYSTFITAKNFGKHYNIGVTEARIKEVGRAKIIQDAKLNIYKSCFEEPINSGSKEYNAVISADENMMVWMRSQKFYESLMMSVKQNGKWSDPVNITPQVGSDGDMIPTGLSADGKRLLLIKKFEFDSDVYYSIYNGRNWSAAQPIKGNLNSNFTEDHASFSPDGKQIYLSSDRRGTLGGLDIWVSNLLPDSTWSEPVNAGPMINTEEDETSPFLSPDGKSLIFSSKGHFNMGGYDVFVSDMDEYLHPINVYNIGFPISTTNDNTYFVPLKDGKSGIYCFRDEEGVGNKDIWYLEIIQGENRMARSLTRLSEENFTIILTDKLTGEKIRLEYDSVNDKVAVKSDRNKEYGVIYSREK